MLVGFDHKEYEPNQYNQTKSQTTNYRVGGKAKCKTDPNLTYQYKK